MSRSEVPLQDEIGVFAGGPVLPQRGDIMLGSCIIPTKKIFLPKIFYTRKWPFTLSTTICSRFASRSLKAKELVRCPEVCAQWRAAANRPEPGMYCGKAASAFAGSDVKRWACAWIVGFRPDRQKF